MTRPRSNIVGKLSARDRLVLDHVDRYRLTTIAALRHAPLRGLTRGAVSKIVVRLCDRQFLQSFPLSHPSRYFVLGTEGIRALGKSRHRSQPLGPQSLPMEFAALAYATLGNRLRRRLHPPEVTSRCPWLPSQLAAAIHCLDEQEDVLELLRVDLGGPPDHVARKCVADINTRRRFSEFPTLARAGKFRLVVITCTSAKAAALRQSLNRHDWPQDIPVHFSIISDLLSLIARKHNA